MSAGGENSGGGILLPGFSSLPQNGSYRPHSAPPAVTSNAGLFGYGGTEPESPTSNNMVDPQTRASFEYYKYYHSQKPVDPRLPPPLINWSAHIDTHSEGMTNMSLSNVMQHLPLDEEDEDFDDPTLAAELRESLGQPSNLLLGNEGGAFEEEGNEWDAEIGRVGMAKKSVFDRIQLDFPRTPSPVYGRSTIGSPPKPAHAKALPSPSNKKNVNVIESAVREGHLQGPTPSAQRNFAAQQAFNSGSSMNPMAGLHSSLSGGMNAAGLSGAQSNLDMQAQMSQLMGFLGEGEDELAMHMQAMHLQGGGGMGAGLGNDMSGMGLAGLNGAVPPGFQQAMMRRMAGQGLPFGVEMSAMIGGLSRVNGMPGTGGAMDPMWGSQQERFGVGNRGMGMGGGAGMGFGGVMGGGMGMGGMGMQGLQNLSPMQQAMANMGVGQLGMMGGGMYRQGMQQQHDGSGGQSLNPMGDGGGGRGRHNNRGDGAGGKTDRGRDGGRDGGGRGGDAVAGGGAEVKRSALLEEFRTSKVRKFELRDIIEQCDEFCRDQHGSRFIQTKLEVAPQADKDMVFEALIPTALSLMTDLFGNYVVQKFMERGTQAQRSALARSMRGRVLVLSLDMYGCRVVQKAIEVVDGELQTALVNELEGNVIKCVRDQNGNHVIQKCIERAPGPAIQFIVDDFIGQVVPLATHPYGCRVIQRILENCKHQQVYQMLNEIVQTTRDLVHDQYGNYVVQHVLEHGQPRDRSGILSRLRGQLVALSQHKFASNVVEKLLQFSSHQTRQAILEEFTGDYSGQPAILVIMRDAYGNYVIQKALDVCQGADRERLVSCIREHLSAVRKFTYGKHIIAHIEKLEAQTAGRGGGNGRGVGPGGPFAGGGGGYPDNRGGRGGGGSRGRDIVGGGRPDMMGGGMRWDGGILGDEA